MRMIRASGRNSPVKKRANLGQAKLLSAWSALALPLIWANGCTEPFESCVPTRTCPPTGGAGNGAEAGEGGSADLVSNSGGSGGSSGGRGGTASNQELSGGAGKGPSSANQAGESSGGAAGAFERGGGANAGAEFGGSAGELNGGAFTGDEPSSGGASGQGGDGDATDYCSPNPCQHGGACQNHSTGYGCTCTGAYVGENCALQRFELVAGLVTDLNADGSIAVGTAQDRAFIRNCATGVQTSLGTLYADGGSRAYAVSVDGSVVVGVSFKTDTISASEGFRWTLATGMQVLPRLEPALAHGAWDVSDDGQVILGTVDGYRPFVWTSLGLRELAPLTDATLCDAREMNADGTVVVGKCRVGGWHAYIWRASTGKSLDLGGPEQCGDADPWAVSADGAVVVGVCDTHAFRWTKDSGMQALETIAPATGIRTSGASGVSRDGSVIVGPADANGRIYIWEKDHGARYLDAALQSSGVDLQGTKLEGYPIISADGKTVAGRTSDNVTSWIARLP